MSESFQWLAKEVEGRPTYRKCSGKENLFQASALTTLSQPQGLLPGPGGKVLEEAVCLMKSERRLGGTNPHTIRRVHPHSSAHPRKLNLNSKVLNETSENSPHAALITSPEVEMVEMVKLTLYSH